MVVPPRDQESRFTFRRCAGALAPCPQSAVGGGRGELTHWGVVNRGKVRSSQSSPERHSVIRECSSQPFLAKTRSIGVFSAEVPP
jgi:hypothetical protein